ncbi:MAG: type II toxin-antitoxin system ParD family antitoxin [Myxococcota bacterium]
MARHTSFSLGAHFDGFIAERVAAGRYGTASEVVRAALRLLEERERQIEKLRRDLEEGVQSGLAESYSIDRIIEAAKQQKRHA